MQVSVYILRCADGSYYTGLTKQDAEARAWEHNNDPIDSYTTRRRPVRLVFTEVFDRITDAIARERQIKGWNRAKKEALMRGDYGTLPALASRSRQGNAYPKTQPRHTHTPPHPEEPRSGVPKDVPERAGDALVLRDGPRGPPQDEGYEGVFASFEAGSELQNEAGPPKIGPGGRIGRDGVPPALAASLSPHGLFLRGGFHPEPGEPGLDGVGTVLLVGNAGGAMWEAFAPHLDEAPDPLNCWTMGVIEPIAARFGARALYPFGEPRWPFQRWAERSEVLHASPLGLLIHPEYGLWLAYRAALLFLERLPLPQRAAAPSPCGSCVEKPCLSACPVGAFTGEAYDVPACAAHIRRPEATCVGRGCHVREACPVGRAWRYPSEQIRFHMTAFSRSVAIPE